MMVDEWTQAKFYAIFFMSLPLLTWLSCYHFPWLFGGGYNKLFAALVACLVAVLGLRRLPRERAGPIRVETKHPASKKED